MEMNYIDNYGPPRWGCLITLCPVVRVWANTLMLALLQGCSTLISQHTPASLVKRTLKYALLGG